MGVDKLAKAGCWRGSNILEVEGCKMGGKKLYNFSSLIEGTPPPLFGPLVSPWTPKRVQLWGGVKQQKKMKNTFTTVFKICLHMNVTKCVKKVGGTAEPARLSRGPRQPQKTSSRRDGSPRKASVLQ
jgi:hypothetical protein